jgi:NAD(P)-dependent dehydrogenase (short-subunit alcohol dehydrogenase family)
MSRRCEHAKGNNNDNNEKEGNRWIGSKGKTAMVVGAGSIGPGWGNGKATAVTFAREGAQVFCVDRNGSAAEETVKIIAADGGKAAAFTADVSRAADVEAMVAACLKAFGRIDMLDNNVGIVEMRNVVEVSEADWDRVFAVLIPRNDRHVISNSMQRRKAWSKSRRRIAFKCSASIPQPLSAPLSSLQ